MPLDAISATPLLASFAFRQINQKIGSSPTLALSYTQARSRLGAGWCHVAHNIHHRNHHHRWRHMAHTHTTCMCDFGKHRRRARMFPHPCRQREAACIEGATLAGKKSVARMLRQLLSQALGADCVGPKSVRPRQTAPIRSEHQHMVCWAAQHVFPAKAKSPVGVPHHAGHSGSQARRGVMPTMRCIAIGVHAGGGAQRCAG